MGISKPKDKADESRRNFLKLAGVSAPAAAAAVTLTPEEVAAAADTPAAAEGLRKTAHVRAYIKSSRF